VREGDHFKAVGKADKYHVIRKAVNRHTPNVSAIHLRDSPTDLRKRFDQV
jgi:predicted HAD superfamily phosphohydrolase